VRSMPASTAPTPCACTRRSATCRPSATSFATLGKAWQPRHSDCQANGGKANLQPPRCGLDARSGRARKPHGSTARRDRDQARRRRVPAHHPLGSRKPHDRHARSPPARRPWGHPEPQSLTHLQRQPLQRVPVQDHEVPTRLPTPRRFGCYEDARTWCEPSSVGTTTVGTTTSTGTRGSASTPQLMSTLDALARSGTEVPGSSSCLAGSQLLTQSLVSIGHRCIEQAALALDDTGRSTSVRTRIHRCWITWCGCARPKPCSA